MNVGELEAVFEAGAPLVGGGEGGGVHEAREIVAARVGGDFVEHGLGGTIEGHRWFFRAGKREP